MTIEELFPRSEFPLRITTHFLFDEWIVEVDYYYENPFLREQRQNSGKEFRFFRKSGEFIFGFITRKNGDTYRRFLAGFGLSNFSELSGADYVNLTNQHLDIFGKFSAISGELAKVAWRPF